MRVLSLIYSHRVQGFSKAQLDLTPTQKRNPNPKKRSNSPIRKLQLDPTPFQKRSPNPSWILQVSLSFHLLSFPTILHLGEDFSNLSRTPTNSNVSSGEIDTRSQRNRYKSRLERSERNRHTIST